MNSRQKSRSSPGRRPLLFLSFPSIFKRSSSPPLITNTSNNAKTRPNITTQFIRFGNSPSTKPTAPQRQKAFSAVPILRVHKGDKALTHSTDYDNWKFMDDRKSFSDLDLRALSIPFADSSDDILAGRHGAWPRSSNPRIYGDANIRLQRHSASGSANMIDNRKNALGSILKKSALKIKPDVDEASDYLGKETSSSTKSKRKVLFKNKVSVFRFDSDGDSGCSSSECEKQKMKRQTIHRQHRRYRSLAPKIGHALPKMSTQFSLSMSPPPPPPPLPPPPLLPPRDKAIDLPPKPKPKPKPMMSHCESIFLYLGDDNDNDGDGESLRKIDGKASNAFSNYPGAHGYQSNSHPSTLRLDDASVSYNTPANAFVVTRSSRDADNDSVANSVVSSKSSTTTNDSSSTYKSSTAAGDGSRKEPTFSYHVINDSNRLVVSVKLGLILHPNDVLVKANKNGTKLRVVNNAGGRPLLGLNEQILLPVSVNPYKLSAKIDQAGNLLIEAPVTK